MIKSKNNIFCVNFTGAFLYSGTVYLSLFSLYPSLCRAIRIKIHHSQGLLSCPNSQFSQLGWMSVWLYDSDGFYVDAGEDFSDHLLNVYPEKCRCRHFMLRRLFLSWIEMHTLEKAVTPVQSHIPNMTVHLTCEQTLVHICKAIEYIL